MNHSQPPPTMHNLNLRLSTTNVVQPKPTINFRPKTAFVRCSQRFEMRNRRKMHTAYNTALADRTTHRTTPVPNPHQSKLRRLCHLYSAGLPPQYLVELQFRDWLSAQVRRMLQRTMGCFDLQVCLLDRFQPDAFMQERTQACPAQKWQFHTPHAQPW